jgi:hypothetical protein
MLAALGLSQQMGLVAEYYNNYYWLTKGRTKEHKTVYTVQARMLLFM